MKNIYIRNKGDSTFFTHTLHNSKMPNNEMYFINNKTIKDNNVNEYYLNNFKLRDMKDWENGNPSEIVALGCSNTYGFGVPQDCSWPSIVERITKKNVANLGICGASAEQILDCFLLYLNTVGKPKYVLACFPEHLRYSHIADNIFYFSDIGNTKDYKTRKVVSNIRTVDYESGEINLKDFIVKLPADPRYIFPMEQSLSQFISSIYKIQTICKLLDIEFYWGTWFEQTANIFIEELFVNGEFCLNKDNYLDNLEQNEDIIEKNCETNHFTNQEDFIKNKDSMWNLASDGKHPGIHWHHHIAENFVERMQ
jgi:hypothetical protein